jgi:hypothetical protein
VGTQVHDVGGKFSSGAQYVSVGQLPLHCAQVSPHGVAMEVEVVDELLVLVLDVVEVEVVDGTQSPPPHASQQLGTVPTQAVPPLVARQRVADFFTPQRCLPSAVVRQQVTAPARPQVDLAAHRLRLALHSGRSSPLAMRAVSTPVTHFT